MLTILKGFVSLTATIFFKKRIFKSFMHGELVGYGGVQAMIFVILFFSACDFSKSIHA